MAASSSELEELVSRLNLKPHPEGGFYRETYRSKGKIPNNVLSKNYTGERNYGTGIYFLLTSDTFSAFHRIEQDELWFFHQGSPIELHVISPGGTHEMFTIGNDLKNGQHPQVVVPGRSWFAAKVNGPDTFGLVSCTVSPGFDFRDFELPARDELCELFPQHKDLITEFTRH